MIRYCSGSDPDCETGINQGPYMAVIDDEEIGLKKLTVFVRKKSQPCKPFRKQMTRGLKWPLPGPALSGGMDMREDHSPLGRRSDPPRNHVTFLKILKKIRAAQQFFPEEKNRPLRIRPKKRTPGTGPEF